MSVNNLKISDQGINLIKEFEGLRLSLYPDAAGLATIGYGHLITNDDCPTAATISNETAEWLLSHDLKDTQKVINDSVKSVLGQNEFDALCSLVFNIGGDAFKHSGLLHFINEGDYETAIDRWAEWNHVNGIENAGLTRRRTAEIALFQKPVLSQ